MDRVLVVNAWPMMKNKAGHENERRNRGEGPLSLKLTMYHNLYFKITAMILWTLCSVVNWWLKKKTVDLMIWCCRLFPVSWKGVLVKGQGFHDYTQKTSEQQPNIAPVMSCCKSVACLSAHLSCFLVSWTLDLLFGDFSFLFFFYPRFACQSAHLLPFWSPDYEAHLPEDNKASMLR